MTTPMLAGVIGWPVEHSRSPAIHRAAAAATGAELLYTIFPVRPGEGANAVGAMRVLGLRGLSVTMPHKDEVIPALDELTEAARRLGAVNHITNDDGHLIGNNTDGDGFVRGYEHVVGSSLAGARVAVLGSGGAARAIVDACAGASAAAIDVIARSPERAASAAAVGGEVARVSTASALADADVVVNATPVGMSGTSSAGQTPCEVSQLGASTVVVDIVYSPLQTPLLAQAEQRGLRVVNGLAMLAGQAAEQFEHWTGHSAPLSVLIEAAQRG